MADEPGASERGEGLRPDELLRLVRRRRWTVAVTALAVVLATFALVGTSTPVYRASATVLIDPNQNTTSFLGDLGAMNAPPAAPEMALLASRSNVAKTVQGPPDGSVPHPSRASYARHLGLATRVDDEGRRPLATLWQRLTGDRLAPGRVFASIDERAPDSPPAIRVELVGRDRVRVSSPGLLSRFGLGDSHAEELDYRPGAPLEYRGIRFRLATLGDPTGRGFWLQSIDADLAQRRLLESLRIVEVERNSGVVKLTVSDSDPHRAADTANALCRNYFDQNVDRSSQRASQTVRFIKSQLVEQLGLLEQAQREFVSLQEANPEVIDVASSSQALIERLSNLEVEKVFLELAQAPLAEAVGLIEAGEFEALSLLEPQVVDAASRGYVEQISALTAEYELQDRSDTGTYKFLLQSELVELESALGEYDLRIASLEQMLAAHEDGAEGAFASLGLPGDVGPVADPLTQGYLTKIAEYNAEAADLEQEFTDEYPRLVQLREAVGELEALVAEHVRSRAHGLRQLRQSREAIIGELQGVLDAHPEAERGKIEAALVRIRGHALEHLKNRLHGIGAQRAALDGQIARLEHELSLLPEKESRLAGPRRRFETHTEIVQFLLKSQQEAEITEAATVGTASFIDPAVSPIKRYSPRVTFNLLLGTLLGCLLGLGLAYLLESFRGSIHSEAELEAAAELPVLGSIPDFRSGRRRVKHAGDTFLALRDDPDGLVAEAYRSLRANLRFALQGSAQIRTMAVTSCTPGEGKSVTNADLAIAFANGGKRVLLVDADVRKPTVHKNFRVERTPGLCDVLLDGLDWRSCVRPSGLDDLELLPAGVHRGKPGDLLSRPSMGELVDALADAYDVVVFDLPPALVVADVETFSHKLDAMLLLYRCDGVPKDAIRMAVNRLRQTGSNVIGTVLNAVRAEHSKGGAYYSSYYYYEEEPRERMRKGA